MKAEGAGEACRSWLQLTTLTSEPERQRRLLERKQERSRAEIFGPLSYFIKFLGENYDFNTSFVEGLLLFNRKIESLHGKFRPLFFQDQTKMYVKAHRVS